MNEDDEIFARKLGSLLREHENQIDESIAGRLKKARLAALARAQERKNRMRIFRVETSLFLLGASLLLAALLPWLY